MRTFLLTAPGWRVAVAFGVPFAVAVAAAGWFKGEGLEVSGISGVCGGVLLGATATLATRAPRRDHRELLGRVSFPEWKAVRRAVWSGPVPEDPRLRADALELANRQLARLRRLRVATTIIFGLNVVLQLIAFALGNESSLLVAGFSIVALIAQRRTYHRLTQRVAALKA
ncbi:hypothetical protein AB0E69_10245 [Kribbella sp. NPDC026611]|uniref:hypothetical protein n=1 Tax=Kribbella sp. NPDC026611 TaxID=3154911 RepID=UPI0033E25FC8